MEYGTLEREIHVDASPEVVFEVISSPEHLREWWPDDVVLDRQTVGGSGELVFGDRTAADVQVSPFTIVEAEPPRVFSFRWVYEDGAVPGPSNSLLVRFELAPAGEGTVVRMTESGFRERGWEAAVLEAAYLDHGAGWDHFLPRLAAYVARLVSAR